MENYNHTTEDLNDKLRNRFLTIALIIITTAIFTGGFIIGHLTK
jgi:hypothetical protein